MLFLLNFLASLVIWSYLFSLKFSVILIVSILIHEYGHYYWMGREGITKRRMFFLPPFGAVAISDQPWPTRGAETRIALAGPVLGLVSVFLFYLLWLIYGLPLFLGAMALACYLNLFNLLMPIALLDGGRVIKSILASINAKYEELFYHFGFIVLISAVLFGFLNTFFVVFVGFFLWNEYQNLKIIKARLSKLSAIRRLLKLSKDALTKLNIPDVELKNIISLQLKTAEIDSEKSLENEIDSLEVMVNIRNMTKKEMLSSFAIFVSIIGIYIITLYRLSAYTNIHWLNLVTTHLL